MASRVQRCGECVGCTAQACGDCVYCRDSPNFGGPGLKKQSCIRRKCVVVLEHNLKKEAVSSHRIKLGCAQCDECAKDDCGVCLICIDKLLFDNKYFPSAAICYKKKCNNGKMIKHDPPPTFQSESDYGSTNLGSEDYGGFVKPKRLKVIHPQKSASSSLLKRNVNFLQQKLKKRKIGRPSRDDLLLNGKMMKKAKSKKRHLAIGKFSNINDDVIKDVRNPQYGDEALDLSNNNNNKQNKSVLSIDDVIFEEEEDDDVTSRQSYFPPKKPESKKPPPSSACPKIVELILDPNRPLNPMERAFISVMKPSTDYYYYNNNCNTPEHGIPRSVGSMSENRKTKRREEEFKNDEFQSKFKTLPRATLVPKKEDGACFAWPPTKVIYPISVDTVPADSNTHSKSADAANNPLGFIVSFDSDQFSAHMGEVTGFSSSPALDPTPPPYSTSVAAVGKVSDKEVYHEKLTSSFSRPVFDTGHNYHQIPNF